MVQLKDCWSFQTKVMAIHCISEVMMNMNDLYVYYLYRIMSKNIYITSCVCMHTSITIIIQKRKEHVGREVTTRMVYV